MKQVTIQREKWGKEALRNSNGTMCCLGFCGIKAGVQPQALKNVAMPGGVGSKAWDEEGGGISFQKFKKAFPMLFNLKAGSRNSKLADRLAAANDSTLSAERREQSVIRIGKTGGINFKFTGKHRKEEND